MPTKRNWQDGYECVIKIKGVSTRPILFSQLKRRDGKGYLNPEEVFADSRHFLSEEEREHLDQLRSLMDDIVDWSVRQLGESSQDTIRAVYFEGKTVKQHSEDQYVTVFAVYKRLTRAYPVLKEIILEELDDLDPVTRAELVNLYGLGGRDE